MKDEKFKNLYQSFTGQIDYSNFIESYGEDFIDFSNTNFELLEAQYCGFYLTLLLDQYLIKVSDKVYSSKFIPEFVDEIAKNIAVNNGDGYTLGNLSYKNSIDVLVKIRNKLAHGDFIIKNDEIIYVENNEEGKIDLSKLKKVISNFDNIYEDYILDGPRCKVFNFNSMLNNYFTINNESDFDKICDNIYRIEIIDEPMSGHVRDCKYVSTINYFYDAIRDFIDKRRVDLIPKFISKNEKVFKDYNINLKYSIKRLSITECYDAVKEKYMCNLEQYKLLTSCDKLNVINNISYRVNKGKYQKFNLSKGILLNLIILNELKNNPNYTLDEIIKKNSKINNLFMYHVEDIIISSYLVSFNSLYEYGLDGESTSNGHTNFVKIYDGEHLDFSKFGFDILDDPNMTIEHNCDNFESDIIKYENDEIKRIDSKINGLTNSLNQYLNNCTNKTEEKTNLLITKVEDAKREKEELLTKLDDMKMSLVCYDKDKYIKNINIIYHIRNAIAHGNVFVDSYNNDINETEIIIQDFYDNKVCYQKKIKIKDFVSLFLMNNIENVYDYISDNIVDKTLLVGGYLNNVKVKSMMKTMKNNEFLGLLLLEN